MDEAPFWPIGFFYKGLVIHVVFSLVIWLLGVFTFLVSVATLALAGEDMRAAPLGRIGQGPCSWLSRACLPRRSSMRRSRS